GMLTDDETWAIRYLIVNTSNWWVGHKVLISPEWIKDVSWDDRTISIQLTRQAVKEAPRYDPETSLVEVRKRVFMTTMDVAAIGSRPTQSAVEAGLRFAKFFDRGNSTAGCPSAIDESASTNATSAVSVTLRLLHLQSPRQRMLIAKNASVRSHASAAASGL
ncbi:MAG: hypothetical protein ABI330_22165, partial [Caldimonas sp.]